MKNRTRLLAGIVAAATLAFIPSSAHAGPTNRQPATEAVTKTQAYRVSDIVMAGLVRTMPKPRHYDIADCRGHGNAKIQQCPVEWGFPGTGCTGTLWVWADGESFYYEWHRLRCS